MNRAGRTVYPILLMVCATHLLNDMMQSVIPAVYPLLKEKFGFTFAQIGLITLVFQLTSSLLQPVAGRLADLHPRPYSLAAGMCFTLCGLLALAAAPGLRPDFGVGRTDRLRFVGLPSRILARGPARLGRSQRAGAVDLSGRAAMPEAPWGPCWPR